MQIIRHYVIERERERERGIDMASLHGSPGASWQHGEKTSILIAFC